MYMYLVLPVLRLSKVFGVEGEDWSQGEEMGLIKLPVNTKVILGSKYLPSNALWKILGGKYFLVVITSFA